MAYVTFDMSQVDALADDLGTVPAEARRIARDTVKFHATKLVQEWRRNVRETAPKYSGPYQKSISFDGPTVEGDTFVAVAGPVVGLPQGNMGPGFEFGSINQTSPHMDGNRAADTRERVMPDDVERYVGYEPLRDAVVGG
jgi:hypothetical protein